MSSTIVSHKSIIRLSSNMSPTTLRYSGSSLNRKPKQKKDSPTSFDVSICKYYANTCAFSKFAFNNPQNNALEQFSSQSDQTTTQTENNSSNELKYYSLSPRSKTKIQAKIFSWFHASARHSKEWKKKSVEFSFLTFTFLNKIDDRIATKILDKFLTIARRKMPHLEYLWTAERQENNKRFPNNIHFHMFTNVYWNIQYFQKLWNTVQVNSGILSPDYNPKIHGPDALAWHIRKTYNPKKNRFVYAYNGLDVKKIKQFKTLSIYITKYVTKQNSKFFCRPYHSSKYISHIATSIRLPTNFIIDSHGRYIDSLHYAVSHPNNTYFDKKTNKQITPEITHTYYPKKQGYPDRLLFSRVSIYQYNVVKPLLDSLHWWNAYLFSLTPLQRKSLYLPCP